ncbi:MAG: GGDEF domain-containing protein [Candidatus Omnitrophota bacterium]|nr:GGDEF domain-containing protein [Candidatus Omnitrophota bacterium]
MLYWVLIIFIFLFLAIEIYLLNKFRKQILLNKEKVIERNNILNKELEPLKKNMDDLEQEMAEHFFFYDIARKIAPFLDKKDLFRVFCEEMKYLGTVEDVKFSKPFREEGYAVCKVGEGASDCVYIKTKSKKITQHLKLLTKLLGLCVERIALYEKFQQLSIYDPLTGSYNRRYFMARFFEEFERAQKFSLNMSFLMIDIDNFKNINDAYGHLVGDAVLKEITRFIRENIREIDFVSRIGGEEFSIILLETDRTGAIMVAERICSRISAATIKAFDEILNMTISIGVASFPQNTLHVDVLMEIADKALYKAKLSGKNRVCWF